MKAVYEDLEQADGNDLIDELQRLQDIILSQIDDPRLLNDFETIVVELTKREF